MPHVALLGPPGVGKSTLAAYFRENEVAAFDLEQPDPKHGLSERYDRASYQLGILEGLRMAIGESADLVVAGAGLGRHRFADFHKVLLWVENEQTYVKVFRRRYEGRLSKLKQDAPGKWQELDEKLRPLAESERDNGVHLVLVADEGGKDRRISEIAAAIRPLFRTPVPRAPKSEERESEPPSTFDACDL